MTNDEFLMKLYEDNRRQAQVHEDRRSAATALIVGGGGALVTAIADNGAERTDAWLAIVMIVLGYAGWLIAVKATERMRLHNTRSYDILKALDAMLPGANALTIRKTADDAHKKEYPWANKMQLSGLWQRLNLLVAVAGIAMVFYAYQDLWQPYLTLPALG